MEESTPADAAPLDRDRRAVAARVVARRRRPAVIGIDVGTSGVKGLLAADSGAVATARWGYRLDVGADGHVELDAETVWNAVRRVIRSLTSDADRLGHRVVGICAGGSGDEAVWLDDRDRPVARIPMALDGRSASDGQALIEAVGHGRFVRTTGLPPSGAYPVPRLRWLAREVPAAASRVRRLLAWPEFVALQLGVEPLAEPTLAARTAGYDVGRGEWDAALLDAGGVARDVLPRLGVTGSVAGRIPPTVAARVGLDRGVAVVAGGFDQAMATRGAGIRRLGVGHLGTGTWEALSVLADEPPFGLVDRGFSVGPTIDADTRWSVMTSFPGGAAMGRLELLGDVRRRETALSGGSVARVLGIAARAPDAPTGILVRGGTLGSGGGTAFAGLRLDVLAPGLARAVLEGIAFDVADAVDELASAGGRVDEIRISGGTAVDPRWIQLRADVLGLPITAVKPRDAGVAAAAALAWSATVGDRSIGEVLGRLVRHDPPVGPRPDHHERYLELRQRRSALSARLGELAKDTATIGR